MERSMKADPVPELSCKDCRWCWPMAGGHSCRLDPPKLMVLPGGPMGQAQVAHVYPQVSPAADFCSRLARRMQS